MPSKGMTNLRKRLVIGGVFAGLMLMAFGGGSIVAGLDGRAEIRDNLARENIVGTPDSSIPGQRVDTGGKAKAFAEVMRKHTLEITGGQTYAEMPRFVDEQGRPTGDENRAAQDPESGQPMENPLRQLWVTETALTTALNTAYFAESVTTFSIAMGIALLLTGIGFLVLTWFALRQPAAQEAKVPGATVTA